MRLGIHKDIKKLYELALEKNNQGVMILQLQDGKYYFGKNEIDISNISASVIIIDNIPRPEKGVE